MTRYGLIGLWFFMGFAWLWFATFFFATGHSFLGFITSVCSGASFFAVGILCGMPAGTLKKTIHHNRSRRVLRRRTP